MLIFYISAMRILVYTCICIFILNIVFKYLTVLFVLVSLQFVLYLLLPL